MLSRGPGGSRSAVQRERRITDFLEALAGFMSSTAIDAGVPALAELPMRVEGLRPHVHLVIDDRVGVVRPTAHRSWEHGEALTELALVV